MARSSNNVVAPSDDNSLGLRRVQNEPERPRLGVTVGLFLDEQNVYRSGPVAATPPSEEEGKEYSFPPAVVATATSSTSDDSLYTYSSKDGKQGYFGFKSPVQAQPFTEEEMMYFSPETTTSAPTTTAVPIETTTSSRAPAAEIITEYFSTDVDAVPVKPTSKEKTAPKPKSTTRNYDEEATSISVSDDEESTDKPEGSRKNNILASLDISSRQKNTIPSHQPSRLTSSSSSPSPSPSPVPLSRKSKYTSYYGRMEFAQMEFQAKMNSQKVSATNSTSSASSAPIPTTYIPPQPSRVMNAREGYPIDWNKEFQSGLEMQEATTAERLAKNLRLSALSKDFVAQAKKWGKIIIEEMFIHATYNHCRTVDPIEIGGQAGGQKYIYNGILFKVQTDWKKIYGGDLYAMKSGGLELKGLMRYYGYPGLHVPLMTVIDYRGFRLVAMSLLPITKTTIVYGSADGGRTIHTKDEEFNQLMAEAGKSMNIKMGICGKSEKKILFGPTDIEGHIGEDGRRYVLDFARLFPPTAEEDVRKTFLYKVFRPEFVKSYKCPLSSDAFSPFGKHDPKKDEHEFEATKFLFGTTIPNVSAWLDDNYKTLNLEGHFSNFTEIIHRNGINVRYSGKVRKHLKTEYLKKFVLSEMVARIVKNRLREKMREKMRVSMEGNLALSGEGFMEIVLESFNKVLGSHLKSDSFWKIYVKSQLIEYFRESLTEQEKDIGYDIKANVDISYLFFRLLNLTGMKLTKYARQEFRRNLKDFKMVIADIKAMKVKVKKMNSISFAEGNYLSLLAMESLTKSGSNHHDRLFRLAMIKFDSAILATPDNNNMLKEYATILTNVAVLKTKALEPACIYFEKALEKFRVARCFTELVQLGNILQNSVVEWSERVKAIELSLLCYQEVLKWEPKNEEALRRSGEVYIKFARLKRSDDDYARAGECFRKIVTATTEKQQPSTLTRTNSKKPAGSTSVSSTSTISSSSSPSTTFSSSPSSSTSSVLTSLVQHIEKKEKEEDLNWLKPFVKDSTNIEVALIFELFSDAKSRHIFDCTRVYKPELITQNLFFSVVNNLSISKISAPDCLSLNDEILAFFRKKCYGLTSINLSRCTNITDSGILQISNIPSLTSINISDCTSLTSVAFKAIVENVKNLKEFNFSGCSFDGSHLAHLEWMSTTSLSEFRCSNVNISPSLWCSFMPMINRSQLTVLDLSFCENLTDECVTKVVTNANKLSQLVLSHCENVTDDGVYQVAQNCRNLSVLDVSFCPLLTTRTLVIIGTFLTSVKRLKIDNNPNILPKEETDESVGNFAMMVQNNLSLNSISLACIHLTDNNLSKMVLCKNLTEIDLERTLTTDLGIQYLTKWNKQIISLNLADCYEISDAGITFVTNAAAATLKSLNIRNCTKISSKGMSDIAKCKNLTFLDASMTKLKVEVLSDIVSRIPKLTSLKLSGCKVTDKSIEDISQLHFLKELDLSNCLLVANVSALAIGCPYLESLNLEKCKGVQTLPLMEFRHHKSISKLNVLECSYLTDELLQSFESEEFWPNLQEFKIGKNKFSNPQLEKFSKSRNRDVLVGSNSAISSPKIDRKISSPHVSSVSVHSPSPSTPSSTTKPSAQGGPRPPTYSQALEGAGPGPAYRNAVKTLMRDLKEIQNDPLDGISALPVGDNLFIWHCNLKGPENTPYAGGIFHIQLKFPENYPSAPPSATIFTSLPHPHVHNEKICLDILSDFSTYFENAEENTETVKSRGWCSAYTVQTILVQIQTFLMEINPEDGGSVAQYLSEIPAALKQAKKFHCQSCPHSPGSPWPEFHSPQTSPSNSTSELDIIIKDLKCYHTRVPFTEDVLGIGISIAYHSMSKTIADISTPLDLLSYQAFKSGVREAVYDLTNSSKDVQFQDWMPLYINAEHGKRALPLLLESIARICKQKTFNPDLVFEVLPKLMNTMVVGLCSGKIHVSVKALEGYISFHRWLILMTNTYPEILQKANKMVANFIRSEDGRNKKAVSSLGDFLALLSITDYQWKSVAKPYLEESFIRHIRWAAEKYEELGSPDPKYDKERANKMFLATQTSRNLNMFHVHFLKHIGRPVGRTIDQVAQDYDALYGKPSIVVIDRFLDGMRLIKKVDSWKGVFEWIGVDPPDEDSLNTWFRESAAKSLQRNYHSPMNNSLSTSANRSNLMSDSDSKNRKFRKERDDHRNPRTQPKPISNSGNGSRQPVCRYYKRREICPHGDNCKFLHYG